MSPGLARGGPIVRVMTWYATSRYWHSPKFVSVHYYTHQASQKGCFVGGSKLLILNLQQASLIHLYLG